MGSRASHQSLGFDAQHPVEDVRFENCTVAGKPLLFAHLMQNTFVKNVSIFPAPPSITLAKALPAPRAVTTPVRTRINEKDGAEMVYVPAGEFLMGSKAGQGQVDEQPQHGVYLDGYWIYKTEVTVGQFRKFSQATGYAMPVEPVWPQNHPRDDTHPIANVTWEAV